MKKILLIIMGSAAIVSTDAQDKCGIKKAYAFYTVSMPGVQMTDGKGNPVEAIPFTDHFIYIECKGTTKPVIESVVFNNKLTLQAVVKMVEGKKLSAGKRNDKDYMITAKKGNTLWKLEILPPKDKPVVIQNAKDITIKGKGCDYHLTKETELASIPRY
jgi:hypothetical protein